MKSVLFNRQPYPSLTFERREQINRQSLGQTIAVVMEGTLGGSYPEA
ncbi:hypothetical protein OKW21_003477 [Catalinimonas alkaloidigena]|nr:hypothetical protein [Catalinimonas alkaloidigena]MDF9798214.1 hypothetical protein [Catalinimonas alkaloidigena]